MITAAKPKTKRLDAADLGAALRGVYRLFRQEADACPVGPLVNAADCLAEAMRQYGHDPDETDQRYPAVDFRIVEIGEHSPASGNAKGGDKRFLRLGLTREVVGPKAYSRYAMTPGGPEVIAVCPTQEAAERVKRALELVDPA
jgi:hypothetical protein